MLEIENSLNQLSAYNKNVANPMPFYPPNYPFFVPPPIPPSSTLQHTTPKPTTEKETDMYLNQEKTSVNREEPSSRKKERSPPVIAHLHAHIHMDEKEEQKKQRVSI